MNANRHEANERATADASMPRRPLTRFFLVSRCRQTQPADRWMDADRNGYRNQEVFTMSSGFQQDFTNTSIDSTPTETIAYNHPHPLLASLARDVLLRKAT
jgi:hypothetical protein